MKSGTGRKGTSASRRAPAAGNARTVCNPDGGKTPLCVNTACVLRKKAGGCSGYEGCPGFKAR